jgi:hypothetical protein
LYQSFSENKILSFILSLDYYLVEVVLCKSLNPTRPWSPVDGVLWLRFVAKGASGIQNAIQMPW